MPVKIEQTKTIRLFDHTSTDTTNFSEHWHYDIYDKYEACVCVDGPTMDIPSDSIHTTEPSWTQWQFQIDIPDVNSRYHTFIGI